MDAVTYMQGPTTETRQRWSSKTRLARQQWPRFVPLRLRPLRGSTDTPQGYPHTPGPPGPSLGYPRVSPYPRGLPHIHLTYHTPSLEGACGVRGVAFSAKWVRMGALLGRPTAGREPPTRALLRLLKFKSAGGYFITSY